MKNIQFTPPADRKIKIKEKSMTARYWSNNYPIPQEDEIVTASTGRRKETRFAKLRILKVTEWHPDRWKPFDYFANTGYFPTEIAVKEGFKDFDEFFDAYAALNNHLDPNDPNRTHYFIEFEVIELL